MRMITSRTFSTYVKTMDDATWYDYIRWTNEWVTTKTDFINHVRRNEGRDDDGGIRSSDD